MSSWECFHDLHWPSPLRGPHPSEGPKSPPRRFLFPVAKPENQSSRCTRRRTAAGGLSNAEGCTVAPRTSGSRVRASPAEEPRRRQPRRAAVRGVQPLPAPAPPLPPPACGTSPRTPQAGRVAVAATCPLPPSASPPPAPRSALT